MIRTTNLRKGLAAIAAIVPLALMGGCSNGTQGALSGAALGSLAGLGIGSVTGDRSDAVTIGAILGGVGGAIIGDQNARSAYRRGPSPVVYSSDPVYVDRSVYVESPPPAYFKSWGGSGHYHHQRHYYRHHAPRYHTPRYHAPRYYGRRYDDYCR